MEFRVARSDELTTISQFYHRIWHETQAPLQNSEIAAFRDISFMQERIHNFFPNIIAAFDGEELVGIVIAQNGRLSQLFVDGKVRGKCVGQKLLELGEAKLRAEGATEIDLNCLIGNEGARRFYERNGWAVSEIETKFGKTNKGEVEIKVLKMVKRP